MWTVGMYFILLNLFLSKIIFLILFFSKLRKNPRTREDKQDKGSEEG